MSIRISNDFKHGMNFASRRNIKNINIGKRKNTISVSWSRVAKNLYNSFENEKSKVDAKEKIK